MCSKILTHNLVLSQWLNPRSLRLTQFEIGQDQLVSKASNIEDLSKRHGDLEPTQNQQRRGIQAGDDSHKERGSKI